MRYCIYKHTSPNGKVYIGCRNPKVRWGAGQKYYYNKEFFADIKYYGWDNIEHTIIQYSNDKKRAFILEQMWISYYRKLGQVYNIANKVAETKRGKHLSEEHKQKMSKPVIIEAAKAINSTPGNIGSVLKGNHKLVKHQYKAYYDDNSISVND